LGGILFLNPGYAGREKIGADRSVAIAHCDGEGIRVEYLQL
jgi:predicted phosphodiesterase